MIDQDILSAIQGFPGAETWVSEAVFGLQQVEASISQLPAGSSVLEVGSGSGILICQLARNHPHISFSGIEPFASGFSALKKIQGSLSHLRPTMFLQSYEEALLSEKYDFIFLINVFEHLPDWRHFVRFVETNLKEGGVCLILCPNYSFPYESHFHVPILGSKKITGMVFKNYIKRFENKRECTGLWESLNFVKLSQVKAVCRSLENLTISVDKHIMQELFERLDNDLEFRLRHRHIASVLRLLSNTGITSLFSSRLFENYQPYMRFCIQKAAK